MKTHLYDRAVIGAPKAPRHFTGMAEPGKVAQKALRDAKKGKDISVYSLLVKTSRLIAKLLPERLMMRLWLMQQGL